jgi:hypothetical protein
MQSRTIRIGGGSAFFDDSMDGFPAMLRAGVDYIVFDYLAEVTMSFLARDLAGNPEGFSPNFLLDVRPHLKAILSGGTKIITNWGGLNPKGAAQALAAMAAELGFSPRIAIVEGDDLRGRETALRERGLTDMFTGRKLPGDATIGSLNGYLGAFPIAAALDRGADVVITGRVVDSAVTLAALIHEFGWTMKDHDRLAAGTLAGHLLECSTQVTGGTYTDWELVPDWATIGNPIAECSADGSFVLTKAEGSGGLVTVGTVAEQMIYEVGDPQAYIVPDVVCDFSAVTIEQVGPDRVRVANARGTPPTDSYKVCTTYDEGWRGQVFQPIIGVGAAAKATKQAQALFDRTNRILRDRNDKPLNATHLDLIGTEASYGARARRVDTREVVAMITVDHDTREGIEVFLKEQVCAISAMAPGTAMNLVNGRGTGVTPLMRVFSFLIPKSEVRATVTFEGESWEVPVVPGAPFSSASITRPPALPVPADAVETCAVPLVRLAWARSGDKGDLFNVGAFARRADYAPYIAAALSAEAVADWFSHFLEDPAHPRVDRYLLPGSHGINFVVHDSLGGGGSISHRLDRLAKGMAQILLEFPIPVSPAIAAELAAQPGIALPDR